MNIPERMPELITHTYWHKKAQFLLDSDTYVSWVLFAVEEGVFEFGIQNDYGTAQFGDVVICPPHVAFYRNTTAPLSFHAITFDFPDGEPDVLQKWHPNKKIRLPQNERLAGNYEQLRLVGQLPTYFKNNRELKQHYFLDLWLMTIREHRLFPEVDTTEGSDLLIRQIAAYLKEHAHRTLEIQKVASEFSLTPVQMIRRFKAVYHLNPLQYLTSIRLKKACSLLLQTDWKLDVIAGHCGYENGYYLSRVFSKHMGLSPSSYRMQSRF